MTDERPRTGEGRASPADPASDDAALLDRLRAGDEAAFAGLVASLTPSLLRIARLNGPPSVAEEVVQDTWLAVIGGLDRFEGRSSLRAWIAGILVNVARTRGRRERRFVPYSAVGPSGEDAAVDRSRFRPDGDAWEGHWISYPRRWDELPEVAWQSKEATAEIRRAIAELPAHQREVVTLRDVAGWSSVEVSAALGLTAGNQRVLLHRGRARVRRAIEELVDGARRVGATPGAGRQT